MVSIDVKVKKMQITLGINLWVGQAQAAVLRSFTSFETDFVQPRIKASCRFCMVGHRFLQRPLREVKSHEVFDQAETIYLCAISFCGLLNWLLFKHRVKTASKFRAITSQDPLVPAGRVKWINNMVVGRCEPILHLHNSFFDFVGSPATLYSKLDLVHPGELISGVV